MKKFLVFILAIIYITVSTGFIVNVHYCMGKLNTIKLEQTATKCCCKKQHKGCCKTEQKLFKLNSSSKLIDAWIAEKNVVAYINKTVFNVTFKPTYSINIEKDLAYNLPPPYKEKRYALLHYCILRI